MHRRVDGVKQGSREGPRPSPSSLRCAAAARHLATGVAALDLRVFGASRV